MIGDPIDILLVEPNPGDTRLFTETFEEAKVMNAVHDVSSGEDALDFVHQRGAYEDSPRPDVILLDPQLPGKSGMDVLAELNDDPELCETPVVVLTSSEVGEKIIRSHGLEADTYIQKPVEVGEFVEFVQSIEDFWLAFVQQPTDR
ncbi:response regulator [Natrarchaeobius halalkaliphilus]|uniref:Response regulator n=2 Tax=Natrarchaeobius halalkaliphilus TaxID=1679091 RepID=A0A3N6NZH4_9EURY|nr:response regulator [Natrarchaeobius halalkaliphilus]